jgi:hypothetical protein
MKKRRDSDELLTNENINFEDLKELDESNIEEPFSSPDPQNKNRRSQLTTIPEREERSETVSKVFKLRQPDQDDALMVNHQPSHVNSMVLEEDSIIDKTVIDQSLHYGGRVKNSVVMEADPQDF